MLLLVLCKTQCPALYIEEAVYPTEKEMCLIVLKEHL